MESDSAKQKTASKEESKGEAASLQTEPNLKWGPQSRTSIRKNQKNTISDENIEYIPCLYLPCEEGGNKVVVYFHGNAEDIGLAFDLLYMFGAEM